MALIAPTAPSHLQFETKFSVVDVDQRSCSYSKAVGCHAAPCVLDGRLDRDPLGKRHQLG